MPFSLLVSSLPFMSFASTLRLFFVARVLRLLSGSLAFVFSASYSSFGIFPTFRFIISFLLLRSLFVFSHLLSPFLFLLFHIPDGYLFPCGSFASFTCFSSPLRLLAFPLFGSVRISSDGSRRFLSFLSFSVFFPSPCSSFVALKVAPAPPCQQFVRSLPTLGNLP